MDIIKVMSSVCNNMYENRQVNVNKKQTTTKETAVVSPMAATDAQPQTLVTIIYLGIEDVSVYRLVKVMLVLVPVK